MIEKKTIEKIDKIISGCLECGICMKDCIMLREYGENPKKIFEVCKEKGEISDKLVYSCNMCNKCTRVCPKSYKLQDIFMESREMKVRDNNGKSPMKKHMAVEVHQYLSSSKIFTTKGKKIKKDKVKKIFSLGVPFHPIAQKL